MTPSIHDRRAIEREFRKRGFNPQILRSLRNSFYKRCESKEAALLHLPRDRRLAAPPEIDFHALDLVDRQDSRFDGASKLVFRTRDDLLIESVVLRIASGRVSLCLSTQVGCPGNCTFCATGKMGFVRNLSTSEILDQLIQTNRLLGGERRRVRNVVFMGMGEPLLNEKNLHASLDVLRAPDCFHHPDRQILVSTVGLPRAMVRFALRYPRVNLALSLHSARQETRRRVVPLSERHGVEELRRALEEVTRIQGRPTMIEYLMLRRLTDTPAEQEALLGFLRGIPARINLIPFNPVDETTGLAGTDRPHLLAFADGLKEAGFEVTVRYSLGADIAAACGQLACADARRRPVPANGTVGPGTSITRS